MKWSIGFRTHAAALGGGLGNAGRFGASSDQCS